MKEIVVISGKGGTGKTSITASLAILGGSDVVVADCDVDAADMHLLLQPAVKQQEDFFSGVLAQIDPKQCLNCGKCAEICRWQAIELVAAAHQVQAIDCEGCGYCARICPTSAISMPEQKVGKWMISEIKSSAKMVHAALGIAAENSGKLVAKVKNEAKQIAVDEQKSFVLVDGSPGVGCPVVSSLSGADLVILVTEPSVAGIHDLKRVYQLVEKFKIPALCIINKYDINSQKAEELYTFLQQNNIALLAEIPYDENFTRAMTLGKTIVEHDPDGIGAIIRNSWDKIRNEEI
ncbi:MAG: 4Fe-4S binding protein [Candidatus Cloacimonadales bacterium]